MPAQHREPLACLEALTGSDMDGRFRMRTTLRVCWHTLAHGAVSLQNWAQRILVMQTQGLTLPPTPSMTSAISPSTYCARSHAVQCGYGVSSLRQWICSHVTCPLVGGGAVDVSGGQ